MPVEEGRARVIIEHVTPRVNHGDFPIKRVVGDTVTVEADIFADGHDAISCVVLYKKEGADAWHEVPMSPLGNDRWRGTFSVEEMGSYVYTVRGWIDHFKSWTQALKKRVKAGQDLTTDLAIGADMIATASEHAPPKEVTWHEIYAESVRAGGPEGIARALSSELASLMWRNAERRFARTYEPILGVAVDRERARFGAWYEMFPRSASPVPGQHGTFKDVEARLPYVASMNFDVLYLPPIHPIGRSFRKGRNNTMSAGPDDPGSPWAIGATEGGHKAIHPELGTLEDFRHLLRAAAEHGLEIAMDLAFQCSPDHPYVTQHPEWFRKRPDGTIQYAENPPKKYQDIYPFDFDTDHWRELWEELRSVVQFWMDQGVRIFRVDNPHTKSFPFWHWMIGEIKEAYPETIFLAEAFTRPKVMNHLAKVGFTQSYNYFPWRNTKWEITQYLTELTQSSPKEYLRPSLWPNTPDILTEYLQYGGRPAHMVRLILAATLGPTYGIYGPPFELCENEARPPDRQEYLNSEKYEIRTWDIERADSLRGLIAQVNQIRRDNPAFRDNHNLQFHNVDNEQIIAYSKTDEEGTNQVLVVVNLDPHYKQASFLNLPLGELGLDERQPYQAHDLLTDARYLWNGPRNYVELDPQTVPAHIFVIRRKVRTEHDFDYYL